jgi:hypothetical protein
MSALEDLLDKMREISDALTEDNQDFVRTLCGDKLISFDYKTDMLILLHDTDSTILNAIPPTIKYVLLSEDAQKMFGDRATNYIAKNSIVSTSPNSLFDCYRPQPNSWRINPYTA